VKVEHGLPGAQAAAASIKYGRWLISMQSGGIFESRNAGDSWTRLPTREAAVDGSGDLFPVLASAPDGEHVYAGTANDSIVRIDFSDGVR
jgi:hypothetical protein